jgi:hypothetical protein
MHPVASTRSSLASSPRDLRDVATCTIRIAHPPVLRLDWKTLAQLASWRSKPPDVDACPHIVFIRSSILSQKPINLLPLSFEAQTKKSLQWFCGPNHHTVTPVLRPKPGNLSEWFWGQTTRTHRFWGQPRRNRQPWFWDWIKKLALLVSLCTV